MICAAHFRDRVMHHALMNLCEPVLEGAAIFDSYACRHGKGQLAAVRRAESYARRYGWFLKMDVRKYFDSVDHAVLQGLQRRKFKDRVVLTLFDQVLASYHTVPGRGLPIGNLTSQHLKGVRDDFWYMSSTNSQKYTVSHPWPLLRRSRQVVVP